jgi:hypothetical protein
MNLQFKTDHKYTLIAISGWLAHTVRNEIIIIGFDERQKRHTFRHRRKKKAFYLPIDADIDDQLVFEGHELSFVLDTETNRFAGNAAFNFVTDEPDLLRAFIEEKCLNPTPEKFNKILFTFTKRDGPADLTETPLFKTPSNIF